MCHVRVCVWHAVRAAPHRTAHMCAPGAVVAFFCAPGAVAHAGRPRAMWDGPACVLGREPLPSCRPACFPEGASHACVPDAERTPPPPRSPTSRAPVGVSASWLSVPASGCPSSQGPVTPLTASTHPPPLSFNTYSTQYGLRLCPCRPHGACACSPLPSPPPRPRRAKSGPSSWPSLAWARARPAPRMRRKRKRQRRLTPRGTGAAARRRSSRSTHSMPSRCGGGRTALRCGAPALASPDLCGVCSALALRRAPQYRAHCTAVLLYALGPGPAQEEPAEGISTWVRYLPSTLPGPGCSPSPHLLP